MAVEDGPLGGLVQRLAAGLAVGHLLTVSVDVEDRVDARAPLVAVLLADASKHGLDVLRLGALVLSVHTAYLTASGKVVRVEFPASWNEGRDGGRPPPLLGGRNGQDSAGGMRVHL